VTLPLFDEPQAVPGGLPLRIHDDRVFWNCPHCDAAMDQPADEEPLDDLRADPACCFCRARFAGLTFAEWRKLPHAVKLDHRPPGDWRRA
jgi:hypothetical protein